MITSDRTEAPPAPAVSRRVSVSGLLGDTVLYGLPRVAFMTVSLVMVPLYTRYFGVAEYGVIENLNILGVVLTLIFGLALSDAVSRFYSLAESDDERARILSSASLGAAGMGLVAVAAMAVLSGWLGPLILHEAPGRSRALILLVTVWIAVNLQLGLYQSAMLVSFRRREYLVTTLGSVLGSLAVTAVCLVALDLGLESVFLGPMIGYGALALYALGRVRPHLRLASFGLTTVRRLFTFSLPLVPAALAMLAIRSSDRYFITLLLPDSLHQVGLYSTAEKMMAPMTMLGAAFSVAWTPFAMAASRQGDTRALYVRAFKLYVGLTSLAIVALCAAAPLMLRLLTTPPYYPSIVYTPPLALYLALNALHYIGSIGLVLTNRTRLLLPMVLIAALVNGALNFAWIPTWGVTGAAWATVAALLLYNALMYLTAERVYRVGYPLVAGLALYAGAALAAHLAIQGPVFGILMTTLQFSLLLVTGFVDLRPLGARWRTLLLEGIRGA